MNTFSIGIDIGGTNTDLGLVRDDGRVMAKKNLPTNKYHDASVYVWKFLKGPMIRKFGEEWYNKFSKMAVSRNEK